MKNQIRCTLNKSDLAARQLKISELAYGSEKAKKLFQDMMQQAHYEFGFESDNSPLMIEAIPVAPDSDMLSAAIADTENEVCLADSGDPESSECRRLYRRSAEPTDSVWINRLNGVIPAGQDRAIVFISNTINLFAGMR